VKAHMTKIHRKLQMPIPPLKYVLLISAEKTYSSSIEFQTLTVLYNPNIGPTVQGSDTFPTCQYISKMQKQ